MNKPVWLIKLKPYAQYNRYSSLITLLTSVVFYIVVLGFMLYLQVYGYSYWIVLIMALIASGFYLRTFMVFHDCAHNSFFKTKANNVVGHVCGFLTFTPFYGWQKSHAMHHANVSNLDKRGHGDVWTMTFDEYSHASKRKKLQYRLFRNPVFLFFVAPVLLFVVMYRFPQKTTNKKGYFSILLTNLFIIVVLLAAYFTIGITNYLAVQLPVVYLGTTFGMWLFYIQHQFKNVYWAHQVDWNLVRAAMKGSSLYQLPLVLRWFTGNIGYHTVHHLNPGIPLYRLKKCFDEVTEFHSISCIKPLAGFRSLLLHVWDEESGKLISFKAAKVKMNMLKVQLST